MLATDFTQEAKKQATKDFGNPTDHTMGAGADELRLSNTVGRKEHISYEVSRQILVVFWSCLVFFFE